MTHEFHRISIEPIGIGERGQRYRVRNAGIVLVDNSRNPEFDACRALLARGLTGQLEVWRQGASYPAMRLDLAKGARLTVKENDRIGPRFVRWHSSFEELSSRAVSSTTLSARTATDEFQVGRPRQKNRPLAASAARQEMASGWAAPATLVSHKNSAENSMGDPEFCNAHAHARTRIMGSSPQIEKIDGK